MPLILETGRIRNMAQLAQHPSADPATRERRFDAASLAHLDEPVQRYFRHAIADGAVLGSSAAVTMRGHIRTAKWLPFTAEQRLDGRSFVWQARVGLGPLTILRVTDRFYAGHGSIEGSLFGRMRVFSEAGRDVTRAAAGRLALDSVLVPPTVLPGRGVTWRAETEELIIAKFLLEPEHPEVRVQIDQDGGVRGLVTSRWGNWGQKAYGYIPCGGTVHAERRFGAFVIPSAYTACWWYGTPREAPFFRAEVLELSLTA